MVSTTAVREGSQLVLMRGVREDFLEEGALNRALVWG